MSENLVIEYRWDMSHETQLANIMVGQIAPRLHQLRILVNFIQNELRDEELQAHIAAAKASKERLGGFSAEQWEEWIRIIDTLATVLNQKPEKKIAQPVVAAMRIE